MVGRGRGLVLSTAALLGALLAAPPALADGPGGDVVFLKNGGVLRGTVMEYDPAAGARIQLPSGEVRTIGADLVARVEMGSSAPAPPPAPVAPPAPAIAQLHVEGPEGVEIVGRPGALYEWTPICARPCDRPVHLDWEYRARGSGLRSSAPFALVSQGGQPMTLVVDPASQAGFTLGIVGMVAGGVAGYLGAIVWLLGSVQTTSTTTINGYPQTTYNEPNQSVATVGAALTLGGGALFVGGAIATFSNRSTRVRQASPGGAAASLAPAPAHRTEIAMPAAVLAPIVDVAF